MKERVEHRDLRELCETKSGEKENLLVSHMTLFNNWQCKGYYFYFLQSRTNTKAHNNWLKIWRQQPLDSLLVIETKKATASTAAGDCD